jgi:hypothetical protein
MLENKRGDLVLVKLFGLLNVVKPECGYIFVADRNMSKVTLGLAGEAWGKLYLEK